MPINANDLAHFRDLLLTQQQELRNHTEDGQEAAGTVVLDQSSVGRLSRMDALQGQAMAQASQGRRREHLRAIVAALSRIDTGDYGHCLECDGEIAMGRLQIDPAIALCITCAGRQEHR